MEEKINKLIQHLQGTCKSLSEGCNDLEIDEDKLTDEELQHLDSEIFRCVECCWWYELSEANDYNSEVICNDCNEDKEEN